MHDKALYPLVALLSFLLPVFSLDPESGCPNFFEASHRGWVYKRIPIFDNRGEDILSFMPGAVAFIEQGKHYGSVLVGLRAGREGEGRRAGRRKAAGWRRDLSPPLPPLFPQVHCNKGVSRSASFVLGYLMHAGGLSLTDALELLRAKRKACAPNESFWEQLRQWEARVVERRRARGEKEARYGVGPEVHGKGGEEGREGGKGLVAGPSLPPHLQAQRKGGRSVEPATMEGEVPVSKRLKAALPIGPSRPPAAGGASPPSVPKTGSSPSSTPLPADPSAPPSSSPLLDSPPSLSKSPSPQDSSRKHDRMGRIGPALPPGHLANAGTGGHDGGH